MKKRKSISRGILILILGISLISYNYFLEKKDYAFDYMNEKFYLSQNEIPDYIEENVLAYNTDVSELVENINNTKEEISKTLKEKVTNTKVTTPKTTTPKTTTRKDNYYIGYLEIPKISFKRGFVDINSKDNVVSKNITIISGSKYPNVDKGNFIIAGHSGTGVHSYFKNLYKLSTGDKAYVYYKNIKYTYKIVKIYKQPKNGSVTIYRDYNKTTLTLVTCTKNDKKSQTVYIAELVSKDKY